MFVRAKDWWFNKIPFTSMLLVLLIDRGPLGAPALAAFAAVILCVCAAANYGYALNDLYDVDEDRRAGRSNAAPQMGETRVRTIALLSAFALFGLSFVAAGWAGVGLAFAEIILPLAYSIPPLRLKERGWWGAVADAAAAHVYPAVLAMLAIAHFGLPAPSAPVIGCILLWAAAAGLRGILSHQIMTADRDARAGLATLAHGGSPAMLRRIIARGLAPIELASLACLFLLRDQWLALTGLGAYAAIECLRAIPGPIGSAAAPASAAPSIPLFDEAFYKAWGPILLTLAAARSDPRFLILLLVYIVLFRGHILRAALRLRSVAGALRTTYGVSR
jgi:4-hydroxybenzoate polyprenyltransferase